MFKKVVLNDFIYIKFFCLISILALLLVYCSNSNKTKQIGLKASLEDIFEIKEKIILYGDKINPIFSSYNTHVTEEKIYIPDIGNTINIYEKSGKLVAKLGKKKGYEPGNFNMPYGVAVDKNGYIYVNDRGNNRIQIFDPSYKFHKQFQVKGPVETIMLSKRLNIITVNVVPTSLRNKGVLCLMREFDNEGNIIKSFGKFKKDYIVSSWAATVDDKDRIYVCNVFDKDVHIFRSNRKLWKKIKLFSPSFLSLKTKVEPHPKTIEELMAKKIVLSQESHTRIVRLYVKGEHLFVLHKLKGGKIQEPVYILDIFDFQGNLLYYSIDVPGELFCVTDKLYFVEQTNKTKYGLIRITGLKLRQNSLKNRIN